MSAASTTPEQGPRERNRRGQGARLREEILAAATGLLDESGTEQAVTLRAVARRAGITAPAIYGHFPNREAILLAVVQDAFAELGDALHSCGASPGDPAAHLRTVCEAYLDFAATRPQRYRVMFDGLWNAAAALESAQVSPAELYELGRDALAVLAGALQACVTAGLSSSDDVAADAIALWLGLHGLAHQRAVTAAFPWPADIVSRLVDSLAHLRVSGDAPSR